MDTGEVWQALVVGESAGDAKTLSRICIEDPSLIAEVAEAANIGDGKVRAMAFAVMKDIAESHPHLLDAHRDRILDIGRGDDPWVIPLLAGQTVARMQWTSDWQARVEPVFRPLLENPNKFVRAWALSALWKVAGPGSELQSSLHETAYRFLAQGGSLGARARALLQEN